MDELGSPVADVRYPEARRSVLNSVAALADREYQQQVWVGRTYPHSGYFDDLDMNIHILYDDYSVLPNPAGATGDILVEGAEINRLKVLGAVLDAVIADLGDARDSEYLAHPRWSEVVSAAGAALSAMVLSGGF
ncbi:SCO4402 family protein [Nocardia nova]|uniref:SCO4402 family protein n=1 Tax=Nocardia nova TaxID=37330 RepID=UPI00340A00BF